MADQSYNPEEGWCSGVPQCPKQRYLNSISEAQALENINNNGLCLTATLTNMAISSRSGAMHGLTSAPSIDEVCADALARYPTMYNVSWRGRYDYVVKYTPESCVEDYLYHAWGNEIGDCYYISDTYITQYDADTWLYKVNIRGTIDVYSLPDILPATCPTNSTLTDGICVPDEGYTRNPACLDCAESCECFVPILYPPVSCETSFRSEIIDCNYIPTCCDYLPKDFVNWATYGHTVPSIEKPTRRN